MSSRHVLLPPRVQLRIADDVTGSYPTVSRLGDDSRKGTFAIHFDDMTTLMFDENVTVQYPHLLPSGSSLLLNNTGSSSIPILATGVVRKGVSDQFVRSVRQSEPLTPFNEHKHYETHDHGDDPFYLTGSHVSDVGLGFQSPLNSKTKIEIRLDASRATTLQLSASLSPDTDGPVGSYPMCYYNFDENAWDVLGLGQGWDTENDSGATNNLETQMLGFSPSFKTNGGAMKNISQSAVPFDAFGFPVHPKFHATSSQLLDASDYIDRPFLLEKAILEFTASMSGANHVAATEILYSTFFILNQRSPFSSSIQYGPVGGLSGLTLTSSIPTNVQLSPGASPVYVDTARDVVTWLQVAAAATTLNTTHADYADFAKRELNIFSGASTANWSGRFVMSGSVKTPASQQAIDMFWESEWFGEHAIAYRFGGRSNTGTTSGRGLISEFVGNPRADLIDFGLSTPLIRANAISGTNPYIILPGDRLVFGWQSPIPGYPGGVTNDDMPSLTLAQGPCRLLLYGSQLREGNEFHDTLNQALTSNAVHEAVGMLPVLDQFDVELRQQFSGSYLGEFLTGSMNATSALNRRVVASTVGPVNTTVVIEQAAGLIYYPQDNAETARAKVPSFSRNVALNADSERFFDTLMPRVEEVITGSAIRFHSSRGNLVRTGDFQSYSDKDWNRAFPFEPRYSHAVRSRNAAKLVKAVLDVAGNTIPEVIRPGVFVHSDAAYPSELTILKTLSFGLGNAAPNDVFLLHMFGVGDAVSGTVAAANSDVPVGTGAGAVFRGFKYGVLNALPQYSKAVFRSNSYGQFRDMLEQRLFGKFFDEQATRSDGTKEGLPGSTVGPVTVRFVEFGSRNTTAPNKTYSSNLSEAATSSLPYFDGVVRNREDPLDLTVIGSVDITF